MRGENWYKHGLTKTPLWYKWTGMNARCAGHHKRNHKNYTEKGITVCKRWKDFMNFKDDMEKDYLEHIKLFGEENTTLDREDNNKGYYRKNCRWATHAEQAKNRSTTCKITYKGRTMCLNDWAKELNIKGRTLHARIRDYNWPIERAFNT